MATARCPECGDDITIPGTPTLGQALRCVLCATDLEVISLRPLRLGFTYEDEYSEEKEDDD